jgi:hypothetical protein
MGLFIKVIKSKYVLREAFILQGRNPWYSFSEAESTSGHMVLSEGTTVKITSDTTGD